MDKHSNFDLQDNGKYSRNETDPVNEEGYRFYNGTFYKPVSIIKSVKRSKNSTPFFKSPYSPIPVSILFSSKFLS